MPIDPVEREWLDGFSDRLREVIATMPQALEHVPASTLAKWKSANGAPRAWQLRQICVATGVDPTWLLLGTKSEAAAPDSSAPPARTTDNELARRIANLEQMLERSCAEARGIAGSLLPEAPITRCEPLRLQGRECGTLVTADPTVADTIHRTLEQVAEHFHGQTYTVAPPPHGAESRRRSATWQGLEDLLWRVIEPLGFTRGELRWDFYRSRDFVDLEFAIDTPILDRRDGWLWRMHANERVRHAILLIGSHGEPLRGFQRPPDPARLVKRISSTWAAQFQHASLDSLALVWCTVAATGPQTLKATLGWPE